MSHHSVDQLSPKQIRKLHQLFQNEWWTNTRDLGDVEEMLKHTDFIFALIEDGSEELIAFARVLSDWVFKALIMDVVVHPLHRDSGLGKELMERILKHDDFKKVGHFELYCLENMVPYYERWGFTSELRPVTFMRLHADGSDRSE